MESSSLTKHTASDMEKVVERIPGWALCYIVNGDRDSITDEEIQMVDDFYESYRKGGMEIQVSTRSTMITRTLKRTSPIALPLVSLVMLLTAT